MASSGLLLLLLSSFLICSLSVPQTSNLQENRALQKRGKKLEEAKTAGKYILKIAKASKPFIGLIPVVGGIINSVIDYIDSIIGGNQNKALLDALKNEFKNLNTKIDENQKQLEWSIWASNKYGELETNINTRWNQLQDILTSCMKTCDTEINNKFKDSETFLYELHGYILHKTGYQINYPNILKEHVRCQEDQINKYSAINAALAYKAIVMTHVYCAYTKSPLREDILVDKVREISEAMFKIQKDCLEDPDHFVRREITDHKKVSWDKSEKRAVRAKEIKEHLDKIYHRFDWMVVVYRTAHSTHHKMKWLNHHSLKNFITEEKNDLTVAVARQAKGSFTKTTEVKKAIDQCLRKPMCTSVISTLDNCIEKVNGIKVNETYTAIHVYTRTEHAANPDGDEDYPNDEQRFPDMYVGNCSVAKGSFTGHFKILIKSDEEWMNKNPCDNVDCGGEERGKCVVVENPYIGLCECTKKYYGESCEESMEDYKKIVFGKKIIRDLNNVGKPKPVVQDKRRRANAS